MVISKTKKRKHEGITFWKMTIDCVAVPSVIFTRINFKFYVHISTNSERIAPSAEEDF